MGTDIHCFAERRTERGWELCRGTETGPDGEQYALSFYCGEERNYALFAILAGVQRMTNGGFEPVAPPRGLPADSLTLKAEGLTDGGYYHNATWLTLRELLEFPWQERRREFIGWVNAEQYALFKQNGAPGQFVEESARCVSNAEMDRLLAAGADTAGVQTLVRFGIPYAVFAGPFVTETLPLLQQQGPPDDVRLVLYFDS
jgi:hypothetical protein